MLEMNSTLKSLNLSSCHLNQCSLDELAKGLQENTTLGELVLRDNPATSDSDFVALFASTKHYSLVNLDLTSCRVGSSADTLIQHIGHNKKL